MNEIISYKIKNNNDWDKMLNKEELVDISNNAYFGFRAMQKEALNIIYNPSLIDNLIRLIKESKKFPMTKHVLIIDEKTLKYNSNKSVKNFIKDATLVIEEIYQLNTSIKLKFLININNESFKKDTLNILNKIYYNNI